jgi:hypothetical protein
MTLCKECRIQCNRATLFCDVCQSLESAVMSRDWFRMAQAEADDANRAARLKKDILLNGAEDSGYTL